MAGSINNNNNNTTTTTTTTEDTPTKRESHYNHQRSSLRSDRSSTVPAHSRPTSNQRLEDFDLESSKATERADSETLPSPVSPGPNVPYTRSRGGSSVKGKGRTRAHTSHGRSRSTPVDVKTLDELLAPESWANPYQLLAQPSIELHDVRSKEQAKRENAGSPASRGSRAQQRSRQSSLFFGRRDLRTTSGSQLDLTALPTMTKDKAVKQDAARSYIRSKPTPSAQRASRIATELYTISHLILFSILGTLARLGLQALTFYPGAPAAFSELWANVAGTFVIGFLAEDQRLFHAEWGSFEDRVPEPVDQSHDDRRRAKARHGKTKKTIPLYIGLATGFCGSFTSFSSFIRDVFLALSNDLGSPISHPYPANAAVPSTGSTVSRNGGYSFMAVCAILILTISSCYSALKFGAHLASFVDPLMPTLPFRLTRRFLDPLVVLLGWGAWTGAVVMTVLPPQNAWRGQALFACVFAPVGCLVRYYLSLGLNTILPSFPLGTFAVNIFGTAVLGMAYDLQRVPLRFSGIVGGSLLGCQVLQGVMDGFCGALTTVSTWILEIDTLKRRHAYMYGVVSIAVGLGLMVAIMGSVRWTVGWQDVICIV